MRKWKAFLPIIIITLLFSSQVLPIVNPVRATNLDSGSLLLLTSAQNGDTETVRRLVAEKVDIEAKDDYGTQRTRRSLLFSIKILILEIAGVDIKEYSVAKITDIIDMRLAKCALVLWATVSRGSTWRFNYQL